MMQRLGLRATPKKNNSNENENANAWSSGPAKALPLVYCDERGKFEMDPQAVAALHLVKGPLGVVSLCGRARQGKSFILNQDCSAGACERNWSAYSLIHTKIRNRLSTAQLERLVFCRANLRLFRNFSSLAGPKQLLGRSNGFQVASTHRPCTKGLWMWSTPLKRIAPDGTEYNLLLLDSEGIDAYDQTGTYSTQIFSLAVLLSSMFVYNQMGAIDEAALDRLSLVTEMTKHIRVRASGNRSTAAELGQFSPIFLWLLRDFYFDLTENGQTITPREYLESALQPMAGSGKAIAAKNEIRESIRALFPDRECFTLVRPINDEHDLQRLDQLPLEKMRPEFRVGLDSLTKFIFERTRPKQVGSTTMTGPLLAGLIQSFLDALNSGAVPTIATSWQNVEENECRRACDCALEVYTKSFDKSFPADEEVLQEVHESAVQKCLEVYNSVAVGAGAAQHKYEKQLLNTLKKEFEQHRLKVFMEAELKCVKAIERMDEKLRAACNAPSANMDHVLEVLNSLMIEYEQHTFTQLKWQKLAKFFLQSLDGPLSDLIKKLRDRSAADYSALALKCRSLEDKLVLLGKQLDASQKDVQDWKRRYEAVSANNKLTLEEINAKHTALQSKYNTLDDKFATASHQLEVTRKHSSDWRSKYEQLLLDRRVDEERLASETTSLQSRCSAAEVRLAAAREQLESAKEEASEWRRKHDAALLESRAAVGKATTMQDRASKQAQAREDALRTEFTSKVEAKERELRDALKRLEHEEDQNAKLSALVKEQEARLSSHDEELVVLRSELHHLGSVIDNAKAKAQSAEREVAFMKQERNHEEERLNIELKRLEAAEAKCRLAEEEVKRASEIVEKAREEASLVEREKHEVQRLAVERLTSLERLERLVDGLHRDKEELVKEVEQLTVVGQEASSKITTLEKRLEEREKEIENLLHSEREQRADSVQVLQSLLASERQANAEANSRAEALSLQLQITQAKLDQRQQELTTVRLNETALDTKVKAMNNEQAGASRGKRHRADDFIEEAAMDADNGSVKKGARVSGNSPTGGADSSMRHNENDDDVSSGVKDSEDYLKFTIAKLKQELTKAGFAGELFQLRNPTKKDIVNIYEKHIFKK